jgi:hypothetical protein
MRCKLALSTLVIASLFGATAIVSAQTTPAPGASSEGNVGPSATGTRAKSGMTRSGTTTTGMTRSQKGDAARNPSSEGNVGPGTNNNNGPAPGGR